MALIIFHCQDAKGQPLGGVVADSEGGPGPWSATSNPCGDMVTELAPASDYLITFSKSGYADRTIEADLAECGIVTVGLDTATTPISPIPPFVPSGDLPPVPTRAQVCAVQHSLAGLTYHTTQYGPIPAWFYGALNADDRALARRAHRAAGDTHIPFPITEAYREGGTLWPPDLREGYDYTSDEGLMVYRAIATEIICDGFFIDCALGGDGQGAGPGWNDPVGKTYGFQWLMDNFPRIAKAMQGDGTPEKPDLTKYILFRNGWDGVFVFLVACVIGWWC